MVMKTVAMSATSAWLVQMLEVAFSRRMCCSRVESVSTKPRRPCLSFVSPTRRPGIWRTYFSFAAITPQKGPPIAGGHAEGLRLHDDDVGFDGRADDAERGSFRNGDDQQRALFLDDLCDGGDVFNHAEEIGRLHEHAGGLVGDGLVERGEVEASVVGVADLLGGVTGGGLAMLRIGAHHFAVFGMDGAGDDHAVAAGDAHGHHGGLGAGGGAVVHRRVGDVHAGELADHGLELEDGLQRALRDFRLVGRVGGEELAALHDGVDEHGR